MWMAMTRRSLTTTTTMWTVRRQHLICPPDLMDMLDMCAGRSAGPSKSSPTPKVSTQAAAKASEGKAVAKAALTSMPPPLSSRRPGGCAAKAKPSKAVAASLATEKDQQKAIKDVKTQLAKASNLTREFFTRSKETLVPEKDKKFFKSVRRQQDTLDSTMAVASEAQKQQLNEVHKHLGLIVSFTKAYKNLVCKRGRAGLHQGEGRPPQLCGPGSADRLRGPGVHFGGRGTARIFTRSCRGVARGLPQEDAGTLVGDLHGPVAEVHGQR